MEEYFNEEESEQNILNNHFEIHPPVLSKLLHLNSPGTPYLETIFQTMNIDYVFDERMMKV